MTALSSNENPFGKVDSVDSENLLKCILPPDYSTRVRGQHVCDLPCIQIPPTQWEHPSASTTLLPLSDRAAVS